MATYKTYNPKMPESVYKPSTYSDNSGAYASDIAKAQAALNQANSNKPAAYTSQYSNQVNDVVNKLSNRSFNYDVNSDALFQQLKSLYNEQGRLAMADTQGKSAALTGGYGNSYGVAASQQAYQQEQNKLYDRIPELQQLALARYQQEGNDLSNLYNILMNQDAADYGRYRDQVTDYENERAYREAALNNLRSMNQNLWAQNEANEATANNQAWNNYWTAEQQTAANRAQAVSEDQWQAQFAENQRQFNEEMDYRKNYASTGSSGGSGSGSDGDAGGAIASSFSNLTGSYRYKDAGTKFTDAQYKGWQTQVGMNRTTAGRCAAIEDAYNEGKITEKQANETLAKFKISEDEFMSYRAIAAANHTLSKSKK